MGNGADKILVDHGSSDPDIIVEVQAPVTAKEAPKHVSFAVPLYSRKVSDVAVMEHVFNGGFAPRLAHIRMFVSLMHGCTGQKSVTHDRLAGVKGNKYQIMPRCLLKHSKIRIL